MKQFLMSIIATLVLLPSYAFSEVLSYPTKPIHLVVGFSPGGGTDVVARLLATEVSQNIGQPVVVENRPGGSGLVAAGQIARATADGYSLMMGVVSVNTIMPHLNPQLSFDPVNDFTPVTLVASVPHIIVVHPSLPVHSLKELISYAKEHPGEINFPSAGNGTTPHIAGEMFKHMAEVDLMHIPYKSSGQSIPDLIAGRVTVGFDTYPAAAPLVRAGQVRAIAVTSAKRLPEFPNVPTVEEAGLPGYRFATWYGIFAPKGTSKAVVTRLHSEFSKASQASDIREHLVSMGIDNTVTRTPEDFAMLVRNDLARFGKIIKEAKIVLPTVK